MGGKDRQAGDCTHPAQVVKEIRPLGAGWAVLNAAGAVVV